MRPYVWIGIWAAASCLTAAACSDGDGGPEAPRGCDPLTPTYCGFPYPNDYWTVEDPSTPTGKRLAISREIIPEHVSGTRGEPEPFNVADGFSPGIAAMTHLPGASPTGLPTPDTIAASLEPDSPTVLLDTETGERVPHWVDIDWYVVRAKERELAGEEEPSEFPEIERPLEELHEEQTFMIRPAVRLEDDTRYIAAVRDVVDDAGSPIPPSPAFEALRDDTDANDPSVQERRAHFEDLFQTLDEAGVARDNLQIAWDFTTASRQNNTQWMVHMRDEALSSFPDGVPYTVEATDEGLDDTQTACVLSIQLEMPIYTVDMNTGEPSGRAGSVLAFGEDGMPEQTGTHEYAATMVVPLSAQSEAAPLVEFGHGQLGTGTQVLGFQEIGNTINLAAFGLDWKGFAVDDQPIIIQALAQGRMDRFRTVPERLHQGFLNFLLAMRTLSREAEGGPDTALNQALTNDCGGAEVDGSTRYYFGGSQGGILGGSLMALTTDIERGVLAVPGQAYNLLLNRSVNFDPFAASVYPFYGWSSADMQMNLALIQGLWDRADPTGYTKYIRNDTLPDTPSHDVFIQVSKSDWQVTNLGAHIMARAIGGVANLAPTIRPVFGIDEVSGPHTGSSMIEVDFGNPDPPDCNIHVWDQQQGGTFSDPHGRGTEVLPLADMIESFYETGTTENLCEGPCDHTNDLEP